MKATHAISGRKLRQFLDRESVAGYLCTLPFTIGFFAFTLFPILASLYYSFTDFDILSSPQWWVFKITLICF